MSTSANPYCLLYDIIVMKVSMLFEADQLSETLSILVTERPWLLILLILSDYIFFHKFPPTLIFHCILKM